MRVTDRLFGDDASVVRDTDFQILLSAYMMGALGVPLISPLLDTLAGVFAVSDARVGLLVTAFTAPSVVVIPIIGMIADRYGRKPTLAAGLVLFGVGGAGVALAGEFRVALGLRLLQGVGYSAVVPVIVTSLGDLYGGSELATAQGLQFASSGLSTSVGPFVAGLLVLVGWRYPLALYLGTIPVAAAVLVWFDEPAATEAGGAGDRRAYVRDLLGIARRPGILPVLLGLPVVLFCYLTYLTYNSILVVRVIGASPAGSGVLVAVSSSLLALAASQVGRLTARLGGRRWPLLAASNIALGAGLILLGVSPSLPVAVLAAAAVGIGYGGAMSLYRGLVPALAPAGYRGGLVSLSESGGRLAATAAPIVVGIAVTALEPGLGAAPALRVAVGGAGVGGGLAGLALVGLYARA